MPVYHNPLIEAVRHPETKKMTDLNEMILEDTDGQLLTNGEAKILSLLESIQDQLDELTEKVNNLNLLDNSGLSVENY